MSERSTRAPAGRRMRLASALLCAIACHPVYAAADATPQRIPDALQAGVEQAQSIGRQLFRLDRAAWVATDTMLADPGQRAASNTVRGWITRERDVGVDTSFYNGQDPPRPVYSVTVESSGRSEGHASPVDAVFDATELAMIRARTAAMSQPFLKCAHRYNSVVYPQADGVHVYLMPGTTQTGVHPAGGHHLFVYDHHGEQLRSQRAFTRGCIDLGEAGQEQQTAGFFVTHLLDPHPTQIHVFISLAASVPLYVATPGVAARWKVDNGVISLLALADDRP